MALVTTKEMFKKAYEGHYAIGAFNINDMEIIQAVVNAAKAKNSAVILQVSSSAIKYAGAKYLTKMVEAAIEVTGIDLALHLDHGANFNACVEAIEAGFSSVMIDGSQYTYEENVKVTKAVVEYAHARGVVVEAELGQLAGVEDDVSVEHSTYTDPSQVVDFVTRTGCDSLAIAIGTSHGAFKFAGEPKLEFHILEEVQAKLPGFPIVLHGASSVDASYVATCNANGGQIKGAQGVPNEMLRKAASLAVCKINMDTDLRLGMTAALRKFFGENPSDFDPRKFMGAARSTLQSLVEAKIENVLGSKDSLL
ncbi:MAG TPA: class II fructose-1,6-bisphosphate aldolase [Clostridiaceae bacterium]